MAWKRGTQNNIPGEIRKGHIREFLFPSAKDASVSSHLRIIEHPNKNIPENIPENIPDFKHSTSALISPNIPDCFVPFLNDGILFIHSHDHPRNVLRVLIDRNVPKGCIVLNETHRINSKVCVGELQEWTIYRGDSFAYDAREGAIGDTAIRLVTEPPPMLQRIIMTIRPRNLRKKYESNIRSTGNYCGNNIVNNNGKNNNDNDNGDNDSHESHETNIENNNNSVNHNMNNKQNVNNVSNDEKNIDIDVRQLMRQYSLLLYGCIVSTDDIYTTQYSDTEIVGRIAEVTPIIGTEESGDNDGNNDGNVGDNNDDNDNGGSNNNEEEEYEIKETHRGIIGLETEIYFILENPLVYFNILNSTEIPSNSPHKDLINVYTKDDECFPVLRRLLRPCISLTSIVQNGRGIYRNDVNTVNDGNSVNSGTTNANNVYYVNNVNSGSNANSNGINTNNISTNNNCNNASENKANENVGNESPSVHIDVDACTFDKVLLYLEHEVRGEKFKFDPLLAAELREAAVALGVRGLEDICDTVLGSFQERVRRSPIRLAEVIQRNKVGSEGGLTGSKRGETLLLLDRMVLDITRWLPEHPGGSSIIPEQALNVDSTVFFEIYHASKQSFLYLKEFYIGELADEDVVLVPTNNEKGSPAFLEQLRKLTKWRLTEDDMILYKYQKSF